MPIFMYLLKIKSPDTASRFLLTYTNMKAFALKAGFYLPSTYLKWLPPTRSKLSGF